MLLDRSGTGNATETFTAPGAWDLQWSYTCKGPGVFVVDVFKSDRTPDFKDPGVSEQGDKDSGVYHVPEEGQFYLDITTTCAWSVKVVESA